ncbi:acetyl-CoA acetyltransferase [Corynebacterium sp.]|uniref:acetyl-CoA acetyltransferase n=1 Tax=Corynebacterium sp. TaxID=1720 RepID=UPI0026E0A616|nr:acetyl-CoA acetyltransferase [Corynebacterium sp.]MDO5511673.1 acetyl-CoA acetyltransferase [Corynebacterium sp.]
MFNATFAPVTTISHTSADTQQDPFTARFGDDHRLPRGMREEAAGMSWPLFIATYAPAADIRIAHLEATHGRGGQQHFAAEMIRTSKTAMPMSSTHDITAMGPVSAASHLLADAGRHVEILAFHQTELFEATVTFVKVAHQNNENRTAWALGFGATNEASIAAALASGAQRIYG